MILQTGKTIGVEVISGLGVQYAFTGFTGSPKRIVNEVGVVNTNKIIITATSAIDITSIGINAILSDSTVRVYSDSFPSFIKNLAKGESLSFSDSSWIDDGEQPNFSIGNGLVAALGDSLTANSFTNSITVDQIGYNTIGFMTWAMAFSMGQLDCPTAVRAGNPPSLLFKYNRGVGGDQAEATFAHIGEINGLPAYPQYCNVLTGINNVRNNVNQTPEQVAQVIINICDTLLNMGIRPILCQLLPHDGVTVAQNVPAATSKARVIEVNKILTAYATGDKRVIYVPWYTAILDVTSAVSDPLPAYVSDGLHHTTTGACVLGKAWWDYVKKQIEVVEPFWYSSTADVYDATICPNGTVVDSSWVANGGTAGTAVTANLGGIPAGWTAQRQTGATSTATVGLQNRTDGNVGKELVVAATGNDVAQFITFPGSSALAAGLVFFDTPLRLRCEVDHTSTGAIASLGAPPQPFWRVGTFLNFVQPIKVTDNLPIVGTNLRFLAQSPIFILPSGSGTTNNFHLDVNCKAGGLVQTTKFSNVSLAKYNDTTKGAINF